MMLRGLSFRVPYSDTNMLNSILHNVNSKQYKWNVINYQAWKDEQGKILFEDRIYSGKEICDAVVRPSGLILLLALFAFDGRIVEIETYEDFRRSNCQLSILVIDADFIEVYCKNIEIIEQIKQNLRQTKCSDVTEITDENDGRISFVLF